MSKLRILLVDDHAIIREGLKLLLSAQLDMDIVGEAGDGRIACQMAAELRPDIIVMDIAMPNLNGVQATERVKQICPETKIVILSAHEDEVYLRQLLQCGASGYVLKRAVAQELTQAIRAVAAGGIYLDPHVAGKVAVGFARPDAANRGEGSLSDRESEVLRLLARGFTNKEIALDLHLSIKTIETYKSRVMEKLDLQSRADIVRYAMAQGWLSDV